MPTWNKYVSEADKYVSQADKVPPPYVSETD